MFITAQRVTLATGIAIGIAIGVAIGVALGIPAGAIISTPPVAWAAPVQEDEAGWSCVDDGNRICGPGNPEGKPAACYDDGGVIVALWPCHVVVNSDGSADVYEGR